MGVLRGDSASWSSDSPSRIADLVAGSRLDSTSPVMDSASLCCLAKTLTVQVGTYKRDLLAVIVHFSLLRGTLNRLCASGARLKAIGDFEGVVVQGREGLG